MSGFVSKDVAAEFEEMDLADHDGDGAEVPRVREKYMRQLVSSEYFRQRLSSNLVSAIATHIEQRAANAHHRARRCHGFYVWRESHSRQLLTLVLTNCLQQDDVDAQQLPMNICNNTRRYVNLFCDVIDTLIPEPTRDISHHDDILDVIMHQRRERNQINEEEGRAMFPPQLMRR